MELAAKSGNRWIVGPADINKIAEQLGAKELARQRHARHQQEREEYAEHIERNKGFYIGVLGLDYDASNDPPMPTLGRAKRDDDY